MKLIETEVLYFGVLFCISIFVRYQDLLIMAFSNFIQLFVLDFFSQLDGNNFIHIFMDNDIFRNVARKWSGFDLFPISQIVLNAVFTALFWE